MKEKELGERFTDGELKNNTKTRRQKRSHTVNYTQCYRKIKKKEV